MSEVTVPQGTGSVVAGMGPLSGPVPAASAETERTYARGVRCFAAWHRFRLGGPPTLPIPPATVFQFVQESLNGLAPELARRMEEAGVRRHAGRPARVNTVRTWLTALAVAQAEQGFVEPVVTRPVKLLLKRTARAQARQGHVRTRRKPIAGAVLQKMLATCDDSLRGLRDRALLLVAVESGGRRRSELVDLHVEDLNPDGQGGYEWLMVRSKTDPGSARDRFRVTGEAATALDAWLAKSGIRSGPVFRAIRGWRVDERGISPEGIAHIIRSRAEAAGLDPAQFSPHSLRHGYVEDASRRQMSLQAIMNSTGHRSMAGLGAYLPNRPR